MSKAGLWAGFYLLVFFDTPASALVDLSSFFVFELDELDADADGSLIFGAFGVVFLPGGSSGCALLDVLGACCPADESGMCVSSTVLLVILTRLGGFFFSDVVDV